MSTLPPLVLASASPRRRELLRQLGLELTICASTVNEAPVPGETAEALVLRLAWAKARSVARNPALVLAADTTVSLGDRLLGKPASRQESAEMLALLSARVHEVWTGVALLSRTEVGWRAELAAARTLVRFRRITSQEIREYAASGEGLDKAGGYAIQGTAGKFVRELEGSLSNVIGLPLGLVAELYERLTGRSLPAPEPAGVLLKGPRP